VALFQLEGSSNEETVFERVRFREKGCGCSQSCFSREPKMPWDSVHLPRQNVRGLTWDS
jgi:hypothetical protein